MTPLVSVIIPMFNCEKYIERCLESVLQQSYSNIQVVVVDDGSTDKGAEIVKNYVKVDSRLVYIYQENEGPSVARNNAINNSSGKYLLFIDADDYVSGGYVEKLVYVAEENKSELVISGYTMVYEDGRKDVIVIPDKYEKLVAEEWAYRISACCSRMYLREFWNQNDLQFYKEDGARAEDVPIALYTNVKAKGIAILADAGYYYYQHKGSAMNDRTRRVLFGFPYRTFEEMYLKIKSGWVENSMDFYWVGILKFLAHFEFVIYRMAPQNEKLAFRQYVCKLIGNDLEQIICSWKRIRSDLELPFVHKCAIEMFVLKIQLRQKMNI